MTNLRKQIKLMASEYDVGDQSELLECPFCAGGESREPSFTLRVMPEGVVYFCFRASCSRKGFVPNLRMGAEPTKQKEKLPNPFQQDISDLPEMMIPFLVDKFPCMTEEILASEQIRYSYERQRILMPFFDVRGYTFGLQARSYEKQPKAISYFDSLSVPKLHFPLVFPVTSKAVLVEDQFSAMILCHNGIPAVALLGTNIPDASVTHLANIGITDVMFFLDADAADKAIKFSKDYALEFNCEVYYHPKDPKDLTRAELEIFRRYYETR